MATTHSDVSSQPAHSDIRAQPEPYASRQPFEAHSSDCADFEWTANGPDTYSACLNCLPDLLSWKSSDPHLRLIKVLDRSIALSRLRSSLDFIGQYDPILSQSMRDSFETLPKAAQMRFVTAPETVYRIRRLRKEPARSITVMCEFLNGENLLNSSNSASGKQCWTALGDAYDPGFDTERTAWDGTWHPNRKYVAPYLAQAVPIDFFSPNVAGSRDITKDPELLESTHEERLVVSAKMEGAFDGVRRVNEAATRLIASFVKVIMPIKVPQGCGSNSRRSFHGRVLLRNMGTADPAMVASALVHESIHQLLYVLELKGLFVIFEPNQPIVSPWSGRALNLDAFVHACFVWYGLARFWTLAMNTEVFGAELARREQAQCLAGFRRANPAELAEPYAGMIRYDVLAVLKTLRERLQDSEPHSVT